MIIDVTKDISVITGGSLPNVIPGPLDSSGAPLSPAVIATNTISIQWVLTNCIRNKVYFPELRPVGSSGPRYEYLVDTPLTANSIIHIEGDLGVRMGPYMFTTDTPVLLFGNGIIENMEFYGNRGAARAAGVSHVNSLLTDRVSASSTVHVHMKKVVVRDFSTIGIANNYNRMTLEDCTITGNGASSIDAGGVAISSTMGVWGYANSANLRVVRGLYSDCALGAIYGAGNVHVMGATFRNNHRQYNGPGGGGGGHIAMNAGSVSCTVIDNYFWNDVGLLTGASGLELEAQAPWTVIGNQIYNMPGVAAIAVQGNSQHRIRDNRGSGNTAGVLQTHSGTPLWQQSGNYFV